MRIEKKKKTLRIASPADICGTYVWMLRDLSPRWSFGNEPEGNIRRFFFRLPTRTSNHINIIISACVMCSSAEENNNVFKPY